MGADEECGPEARAPKGWYSRGYLPHYDDGKKVQAITYRLADALPAEVVAKLEEQALADEGRREEIEAYLDAGHGACWLRDPQNAQLVVDGWKYFDGARYELRAWVVMPNHVHVLIAVRDGRLLSQIVQSQKSYTAKAILAQMENGSAGLRPALRRRVWQPDYFDRFVRNERHFAAVVDYIHQNPVRAGLVARAQDWPWSSAGDRG